MIKVIYSSLPDRQVGTRSRLNTFEFPDTHTICNLQFTPRRGWFRKGTVPFLLRENRDRPPRRGFVLVLVVVVLALLMLAGFTFSELMFTERKAAVINGRQAQALAAA